MSETSAHLEHIQLANNSGQLDIPPFSSIPQIADRWGVNCKLVYDEIKFQRLVALRIGGKILRVSRAALLKYEEKFLAREEQ